MKELFEYILYMLIGTCLAMAICTTFFPLKPIEDMYTLDRVTVTVYNNEVDQTNSDPFTTASGFRITKKVLDDIENVNKSDSYGIISVSRDLLVKYPYGTIIVIDNSELNNLYGKYFVVLDTLNERFKNRVDILIKSEGSIGKWEDVIIFELN